MLLPDDADGQDDEDREDDEDDEDDAGAVLAGGAGAEGCPAAPRVPAGPAQAAVSAATPADPAASSTARRLVREVPFSVMRTPRALMGRRGGRPPTAPTVPQHGGGDQHRHAPDPLAAPSRSPPRPAPPPRLAGMALEWEQTVVAAADPVALGDWWARALGWVVVNDSPDEYEIRPTPDRLPGLLFLQVPDAKTSKSRLHLDFRPDDQEAEVQRLLAQGARHADIGQGPDVTWVVLADPEDNEFCVLSSRRA